MLSVRESPFELEMLVMFISLFSGMLTLTPPRPRMCVLCILTARGCRPPATSGIVLLLCHSILA